MSERDLIRHLAHIARRYADLVWLPDQDLDPIVEAIAQATGTTPEEARKASSRTWEEALWALLLEAIADRLVDGWDRHGAPSAARDPEGWYIASAEVGREAIVVRAHTKRQAYQEARKEWVKRLLE